MLIPSFITIYRMFSKIFIPRFKDIRVIGGFSISEVGLIRGSSFGRIGKMSFSNRSSVIRSISYCFTTLFYILSSSFSIWTALIAMVYTASFKGVDKEGLFEIILIKEIIPKSKSTLLTVNLASIFNVIINSVFITRIIKL